MATLTRKRIKRFLFVGPTGVGKSTVLNMLFNDSVKPSSLSHPATTSEGSAGTTTCFSTYYCLPDCALTDSVGFGDNRFSNKEAISMLKAVVKNSMVGYNKIYLCLRYGRISNEIRYYIDLLTTIFGKKILTWCTIIFTNCQHENMTKEKYIEINKADNYVVNVISSAENIVFCDNVVHENPQLESIYIKIRQRFLDDLKQDMNNSNQEYFSPQPDSILEWIRSIFTVLKSKPVIEVKSCVQEIQELSNTMNDLKIHQNFSNYYGQCTICLDDMWHNDSIFTKCGHIFHRICIDKWLQNKTRTCPICRWTLNESDSIVALIYFEENFKKS